MPTSTPNHSSGSKPELTSAFEAEKELSYAQQRLIDVGITPENSEYKVRFLDDPVPRNARLFYQDKHGNLVIRYLHIDGDQVYYQKNRKAKEFCRIRLKNPIGNMKYMQAKETPVHVYWTPGIINSFNTAAEIKTLFITEGEIKAFVGSLHGLDIAGIGGIHNFYDKKRNRLIDELEALIKKCNIQNIVLLFDADCLTVKYKEMTDLYTRSNSFYSAVRKFKELTEPLNISVYFSHILTKFDETAKGLDDLLRHPNTNTEELIGELKSLSVGTDRKYVHTISISANSISKLRKYFAIDTATNFYSKYANIIQENEFIFKGSKYRHDGEKLTMVEHKDAKQFVRVGCEYYKIISRLNSKGDTETIIKKWKVSEITRDYSAKGTKNFVDQIPKYDEFCNIPENGEGYQKVFVHNDNTTNYNLYAKLPHQLSEGPIPHSMAFLKHLFNPVSAEENTLGDPFLIALDYLTILYRNPKQILPILCLVSNEQGTGKSTFLKWLKAIYKSNATILGNSEFKMDFNTHYISKLLIMVDESYVEIDKKQQKERIKKLATSTTQFYHPKGVDATEIDYFGKLIMCSNNENNFIPLEKSDIRFFVVKVKPFETEDPDFLDKLIEEIPHFLLFLKNRSIVHPKKTRAWFATEHLLTNQLKQVIQHTRPRLEQDVRDYIQDMMLTHSLDTFKIDPSRLTKAINENSKYKHSVADVRRFLKEDCNMHPLKTQRYKIPTLNPNNVDPFSTSVLWEDVNGRPYEFKKEEWVVDE